VRYLTVVQNAARDSSGVKVWSEIGMAHAFGTTAAMGHARCQVKKNLNLPVNNMATATEDPKERPVEKYFPIVKEEDKVKYIAINLASFYWRGKFESLQLSAHHPAVYQAECAAANEDWVNFKTDAERILNALNR